MKPDPPGDCGPIDRAEAIPSPPSVTDIDDFRPVTPASGQGTNRMLLVATALISLLVHVAMMYQFAFLPIGRIDPDLLRNQSRLYRVKRASLDIFDDTISRLSAGGNNTPHQRSSASSLSEFMLEQDDPAPPPAQLTDEVNLRQLPDYRAADLAALDLAPPEVELPLAIDKTLNVELDLEVHYIGERKPDGEPDAQRPAIGPGASPRAAQSLLSRGPPPGGHTAGTPPMRIPGIVDTALLVTARRPEDRPSAAPAIDFAELALGATTKLDIPEKLDNDFHYTVTKYRPKARKTGLFGLGGVKTPTHGYFRIDITAKRSLKKLRTMPKDVVFLIDISGSVPQTWVNRILVGVVDGLGSLNPGDRFNICFFSERPTFFSTKGVLPYNEQTHAQAVRFIKGRKSAGYTDVNAALSRLLVRDLDVQREYNLILISDGRPTRGVMDTRELINLITRDNDLTAGIYGIGVGRNQNRQMLEFLAYRNKGFCVFLDNQSQVEPAIRDLMSRLRYPIMKDLRFTTAGLNASDIFPRNLPNIHQGETFSLFGRYKEDTPFTMRILGHNGERRFDFIYSRDLKDARSGDATVQQQWAFWKLHHLYSELLRQGRTQETLDQIERLRRKYKLKTLY